MDISQKTDETLVKEIREGQVDLYAEIIKRYKVPLLSYIKRFSFNSDDSEDILQEVYLKVYRNLYGFDIEKKFSSWIYRIAHNETINYLKKNNNKIKLSLEEINEDIFDKKINLENEIDQKFLAKEMSHYLKLLKDKYREILILFYFEEKSYEEIAEILHIPKNTVGTYIFRAKQNLIKELKKQKKKI
jgi:RNA polymerase sigma-70 factor (ECF subfamily)